MPYTRRAIAALAAAAAVMFSTAITAGAQVAAATPPAQPTVAPTNDAPNPYETIEGWAKMAGTRPWGSTSAVDIDKDGVSIWVAERCGTNVCNDTTTHIDPIMKFDATGKMVTSFGKGMLRFPHGIHVDRDGNIWVTDGQGTLSVGRGGRGGAAAAPPATPPATPPEPKGHQVYKFSPDGRLLLTLGKAGGDTAAGFFFQPNDVMVAPNGEIYVAEGHGGPYGRILKFDRTGKLIETWGGARGSGPGQWDQPHALAMDSRGRIFVADRSNNRIVILDQTGKTLDTWYQFSRVSGLWIDRDDMIYAADSESGSVAPTRPEWKRGIRIGSARDGRIVAFIPDPSTATRGTLAAEGVAVDRNGVVYGAEVGPRALKRYVKK